MAIGAFWANLRYLNKKMVKNFYSNFNLIQYFLLF